MNKKHKKKERNRQMQAVETDMKKN